MQNSKASPLLKAADHPSLSSSSAHANYQALSEASVSDDVSDPSIFQSNWDDTFVSDLPSSSTAAKSKILQTETVKSTIKSDTTPEFPVNESSDLEDAAISKKKKKESKKSKENHADSEYEKTETPADDVAESEQAKYSSQTDVNLNNTPKSYTPVKSESKPKTSNNLPQKVVKTAVSFVIDKEPMKSRGKLMVRNNYVFVFKGNQYFV